MGNAGFSYVTFRLQCRYFARVNWLTSERGRGYFVKVNWATLMSPLRKNSAQPVR
jgi:hypothetical protein